MKAGFAQINTVARDFPGNARRLLHAYRECLDSGAEWVIAPELALSGFEAHARDTTACLQALDYLSTEIGPVPLILGHGGAGGESVVSLLQEGEVKASFHEPGTFQWRGAVIGIEASSWKARCGDACDAIFRPGLTPFVESSTAIPFCEGAALIFCNAIGGQGEHVYAGRSAAFARSGECLLTLDAFVESCRVVDLSGPGQSVASPPDEPFNLVEALTLAIRDRVRKGGYLGVVLRLDGSLESEVLAWLCQQAVGEDAVHGFAFANDPAPSQAFAKTLRRIDAAQVLDPLATALAPFGAQADIAGIESLMLSAISDREGCLMLCSASLTQRLAGAQVRRGFCPLGDLSSSRVGELARLLGCAGSPSIDPAAESVIHRWASNGAALEELLAEGFAESEILRWQRRVEKALAGNWNALDILKVS